MADWKYSIRLGDLFRNEEIPFEERRVLVAERVRTSRWNKVRRGNPNDDLDPDELDGLLDELAESEDPGEFDFTWGEIYELADAELCWIDTLS